MELTSIDLYGIRIMEPITTVTDLLVSVTCLYAYLQLKKSSNHRHGYIRLYRYFFLVMAIATCLGGLIGHAFITYLAFEWKLPGWIASMLAVALAERAAIIHAKPLLNKKIGSFFAVFNIIELLVFILVAMISLSFIFVEIHAVYGLLVVLFSFELLIFKRTKDEGSRLALWSVFFAFLAAITHLIKFSIHKWFNYLDISHVFMIISSYLLYKGVKEMRLHLEKK